MDSDPIEVQWDEALFDESWYLRQHGGLARAMLSGLGWSHYKIHGRTSRASPAPGVLVPEPSDEGVRRWPDKDDVAPYWLHNGPGYLSPTDLAISPTPLTRVALIGSCQIGAFQFEQKNPSNCPADLIVVHNSATMPVLSPERIASYDFAFLQVPMRSVINDDALWHLSQADVAAHEEAFQRACESLEFYLKTWMIWNREHGLLTFVANFFVPQENPMGRLLPRYDIRNPVYFVNRLNEHLEKVVRRNKNAYVLDLDQLSASIGRRFVQDDSVSLLAHGSITPLAGKIGGRIEPIAPISSYYDIRWNELLPDMVWAELLAMYRTIRQIDPVKLVVVDLDDTLWHGVSGDMQDFNVGMVEGWHIGVVEALQYLKKRGVLLAIISKNEEARIHEIWPKIFGTRVRLDEFAAVRINWRSKSDNMREVLEGMNLLSRNVVFIDDNPAERDAMRRAFPDMRILGRHPYYLRRILLWAPETQVAEVTDESGRRTEMIQAQLHRETERKEMSREDFLRNASPAVTLLPIDGTAHPRFARVFELLNKTNQYNTTGQRWRIEECETFFRSDGKITAFEATDRFTNYGLVGVVMFRAGRIEQWVMSCRVLGYQIEQAVMADVVDAIRENGPVPVTGRLIETDVNFPCRELFRDCGFTQAGDPGEWVLSSETNVAVPGHVTLNEPLRAAAADVT